MRAAAELAGRVADLDLGPGNPACQGLRADLGHFIEVLQQVVPPGQPPDPARVDTVTASEADQVQRRCRLLDRVAACVPQLTDGPLDLAAQYWVATGKPSYLPPGESEPRESSFVAVAGSPASAGAKPFSVGLFTSTGVLGTYGMWRCYLRGYEGSTTLHRMPWHTWRLQPRQGVRVYEVRDAATWVGLITAYPRNEGGFLQPDWEAVAADYDAVHITLRAITAADGFSFTTAQAPTVAPYWGVESAFWLSWCFDTAELVEVTGESDSAQGTPAISGAGVADNPSAPPLSDSVPLPASAAERRAGDRLPGASPPSGRPAGN